MDLTTTYMGLQLRSPIVASAGPLTGRLDSIRALVDAGIGAMVLPSLFEEQVVHEALATSDLMADHAASPEARTPATQAVMQVASAPANIARRPILARSARRSGAIAPSPPT